MDGIRIMTMELLSKIIEDNNIPSDVHFMSDSGWECDPTEMDGVYYNRENNTIVFTQGTCADREYEQSDEWEILYAPGLIKLDDLEVYPTYSSMANRLTETFKREIKSAGEFEMYYSIRETDGLYDEIRLRRPLFFCIKIRGKIIGYIGFTGDENVLEPEIFIFKQYRNKGYGSRVLKKFVDMAFKEGLWKEKKEIMLESNPPRVGWQEEKVFPTKLISTVRVENEYFQRMMTACGFIENNDAAAIFRGYNSEDDEVFDPVEVKEYYLTKEQYMKGQR